MTWIRKSQPTPGDVHIQSALTNLSVAHLQDPGAFIADTVFPNIGVQKDSDKYFVFPAGVFNRNEMKKRAPSTESAEVGYEISQDLYNAEVYAAHHDIPDQVRANADAPLGPDMESTALLSHQALILRDAEWAANYFTTGVWATDVTGTAGAPGAGQFRYWSDFVNSDPIGDVETGKLAIGSATGQEPNTLVIDRRTWGTLRNHPDIVARINGSSTPGSPAVVDLAAVAQVMGLDRILVSRSVVNSAAEGAADSQDYIFGDNALLCHVAPNPGRMTASAGYTFSWTGLLGAGAQGQRISRFRMEHLKSDRMEIEMAFDQKVVSTVLGYFFSDTLA